jgi:hypothetical protein
LVFLSGLFTDFCEYFDGKLSWSMSRTEWTEAVLDYFKNQAQKEEARVEPEYMLVDQIWRGENQEILLAMEHEHETEVNDLLDKEISHLIDLRAKVKVGIFYPHLGDEKILMDNVSARILHRAIYVPIPNEEYLIILGFPTKKQKRAAILFKAYFLNHRGERANYREQIIMQAPKAKQASTNIP